ncbi:hypothetical protein BN1013_00341 [Candidatus Rubidus massiliensis]|nr:hypothetical protein BN1013_00341 [Candidatus Rubidus massiliensis]
MSDQFTQDDEIEDYGDPGILSADAKVPLWLKASYFLFPIIGIFMFIFFWNGSSGWFDRGYWKDLQEAAGTRYPFPDREDPNLPKELKQKNEPYPL